MDFVQAKSILDKFANTYRAAEFMADALETAASLERRGSELANNVEHLVKEQATQQQNLTAMQAGFEQAKIQMGQQQAARLVALQNEHDRLRTDLAAQRATVAQDLATATAQFEDYSSRAQATLRDLERQIQEKTQELAAKTHDIEVLRAQARQVLN